MFRIEQSKFGAYFKPRTRRPSFVLSMTIATAWLLIIAMGCIAFAGMGAVVGVVRAYMTTTPVLDLSRVSDAAQTTFIYDNKGQEILDYKGLENRIWADLDEIPQQLQEAFVAIEDVRFYSHGGVDIKRLFGAIISNLSSGSNHGGSTISQQLIKMRVVGSEVSYKRKLQEAYLAMQMEKNYSKEQILENYLNSVPLGGSNYGVKAAAKDYFNKEDLSLLTLRECATLAGITRAPSTYNPRLNYFVRNKPQQTDDRTNTVLKSMYDNKFISEEEYNQARSEKLFVAEKADTANSMYSMVYAVEYAIYDVTCYMCKRAGLPVTAANRNRMEQEIRTGGYKIYTTIDPEMQDMVEQSVVNFNNYPQMRYPSKDGMVQDKNSDGTITQIIQPQASITILDRETAQVRAMMGGRQLPTRMKEFNRAYQSDMPVGSSIKPLTCFGPALDLGYSPASMVANIRAPITDWDTAQGYPSNYSASQYNGACTMREGLRRSLNVVAARTLMEIVGLYRAEDYLSKLGVDMNRISEQITGSGFSLGSAGIPTLEMAQAYCAVANNGKYKRSIAFTKMTDKDGNMVLDPEPLRDENQVYSPGSAWMLLDMMTDAVGPSGTGYRAQFSSSVPMHIAGKTGTNTEERGVFFSGITPYYVATVWVGSDRYKPLGYGSAGGNAACPLWKNVMEPLHRGLADRKIIEDTPESLGLAFQKVCRLSGRAPTEACPESCIIEDWCHAESINGQQPETSKPCDYHRFAETCSASGQPACEFCPLETRIRSSVVVLPENSAFRRLSHGELQEYDYVRGALLSLPSPGDVLNIPPDDPRLNNYCSAHMPQSGTSSGLGETLIAAQELYSRAKLLASEKAFSMTPAAIDQLHALADALLTAMRNSSAGGIRTTSESLTAYMEDIRAGIDIGITPTPAPTPEPTPSPSPVVTATPTATPTGSTLPVSSPTPTATPRPPLG